MQDDNNKKKQDETVVKQEDKSEKTKAEQLEEKVKEIENQLKYTIADYRNREKRIEEERAEFVKFANNELLTRLLPAFDTLLLAEKYIEDEGLKISVKKMLNVLEDVGVRRIPTEGKEYDPHKMEGIEIVDGEENKVIAETRPGFMLHDKVLIPALVKVGGKKSS